MVWTVAVHGLGDWLWCLSISYGIYRSIHHFIYDYYGNMNLAFAGYNIRTSGFVGTLLYILFSSVCIWRTLTVTYEIGRLDNMKVYFHVSLLLNALLELIYFMSMWIHNSYTYVAYSLHLLSMFFDVIGFSTVIYMWSRTVAYKNHANTSVYIVMGFVFINMICVFYAMVDLSK